MRRRELITLIGGAAAWPIASWAQTAKPLIGFLYARAPEDSSEQIAAFHRGLADNGLVEGQNLSIEYRWARGQYDTLPALATDLVRLRADVIVAGADQSALAAKAATSNIPTVFVVGSDPVKLGLVSSLNEPSGNATGMHIFTVDLEAKRVGLLHELIPNAKVIGLLVNPSSLVHDYQIDQVQTAAKSFNFTVQVLRAGNPSEINDAFETIGRDHIAAVLIAADPFFDTRRDQIVGLAAHFGVPVIYQFRQYAAAGGLMSYGIDLPDAYRQIGVYVARILKGEKPARLPVLRPSKFEFVINLKTAKALGLTIPSGVLAIADEVIE